VIAYLDTNIVLFLVHGELKRIPKRAEQALERYDLLLSPMVMLELNYLYEIRRIVARADAIFAELYRSIDLRVCALPFDRIVQTAAKESWTRDVFDRIIVSHAKANDEAPLVSSDPVIASHYSNVIW
jgi:PIN domain nuclease of toxin-antitoxin system